MAWLGKSKGAEGKKDRTTEGSNKGKVIFSIKNFQDEGPLMEISEGSAGVYIVEQFIGDENFAYEVKLNDEYRELFLKNIIQNTLNEVLKWETE